MDSFTIAARISEDIRTFRNHHNDADQRLAEYAALVDQETHIPEEDHDTEVRELKDELDQAKATAKDLDKLAYAIRDSIQDHARNAFPDIPAVLSQITALFDESETIFIDDDLIESALHDWREAQPKPAPSVSEHQTTPPTTRSLPFLTRQAA